MKVVGGHRLRGSIPISGAKNAVLALMPAALLSAEKLTLENVPDLADVRTLVKLLQQLGATVESHGNILEITATQIANSEASYELVRTMRASVLVLGPLLARCGEARVSLPGGCAIGTRPVDLHLTALEAMGAKIDIEHGYIHATAPQGLKGARIVFPLISVGATENALMAATLAHGETTLVNAAREPEIIDLAACLSAMGAKITGAGTDTITITGVAALHAARHRVVADRIEAGTYAMAAAITGGDVELTGVTRNLLETGLAAMERAGVSVTDTANGLHIAANNRLRGTDVMTEPFPGFATDLQAQFMALMCIADGASMITETIFENRFMHVPELLRMGANIHIQQSSALVRGVPKLVGAPVMATDLRASSSLILAALAADGESTISRIYHLDRGYEKLEAKLGAVGAEVSRFKEAAA